MTEEARENVQTTLQLVTGKLQHIGHVGEQKIKCQPIRAREIAGIRLLEKLYVENWLNY